MKSGVHVYKMKERIKVTGKADDRMFDFLHTQVTLVTAEEMRRMWSSRLGLILLLLAVPGTALAADGGADVTMAPIWAASAVQLFFTVLSGVGLAAYHRNQSQHDERSRLVEQRLGVLEGRLADFREDGVRRQELAALRSDFDTRVIRVEGKIDEVRAELRLIHASIDKLAGGHR